MAKIETPTPAVSKPAPRAAAPVATQPPEPPSVLGTASQLDSAPDFLNAILYGREGTGKTTAAASMANLGKTLIVQAEAGVKQAALTQRGINTKNLYLVPQRGERLTYEELERLFWELKADLDKDPKSWAGVVWDSLTDIHLTLKEEATATNTAAELARGKTRDAFHTDLRDFGVMTEMVRRLIRRYRDLPCHFVCTAMERRDTDDDGAVAYGPAITPALAADVPGFFDVVGHTTVEDVGGVTTYLASFQPIGKFRAKDRYGVLPPRMPNPTVERITQYVSGKLTAEKDPDLLAVRQRTNTNQEEK